MHSEHQTPESVEATRACEAWRTGSAADESYETLVSAAWTAAEAMHGWTSTFCTAGRAEKSSPGRGSLS